MVAMIARMVPICMPAVHLMLVMILSARRASSLPISRTASDRSKDTERIMIFAALVEIEKTRKIAEMNRTLSEISRRLSE